MQRVGLGRKWGKREESCKGLWEHALQIFPAFPGVVPRQENPSSSPRPRVEGHSKAEKILQPTRGS